MDSNSGLSAASHWKIFLWSLSSALAGFLFGFDTVVISGAERTIQELWDLDGAQHGWAMSAALWGTVLGAMAGGWPADRLGRKGTLIWIGALYLVSAVWSGLAPNLTNFILARFIGGVGVGISTVVGPMYISEIAPADRRGRLAAMFQFNIVLGILVAYLSNWLLGKNLEVDAWRWMLGVEAVPAVIYTLSCLTIPESPRWLITMRGDREAGRRVLALSRPDATPEQLDGLVEEIEMHSGKESSHGGTVWHRLRTPLLLAFLIAMFNQLSGINVILYYAPRLLGLAGIDDPLQASIWLGVVNLVFTLLGLWLIDRLGRKTLLLIGSVGYILSLGICAWAFLTFPAFKVVSSATDYQQAAEKVGKLESAERTPSVVEEEAAAAAMEDARMTLVEATGAAGYRGEGVEIAPGASIEAALKVSAAAKRQASELLGPMSTAVLLCLLGFIAAHAIGQGAVIWVFISEIFPNAYRGVGQSVGCATHWIFAALLAQWFPKAIATFDAGYIFAFFACMMMLQLLWVVTSVPETKGVPLEEMEARLGVAG